MKIKMLRTVGTKTDRKLAELLQTEGHDLKEGDVGDVSNELAERLMVKNLAESAEKKATVKAVAKKPAISGNSEDKKEG